MQYFSTTHIASSLRKYRQWHRWIGVSVALLVLISSLTGILLAWKKNSDLLQPPTMKTRAANAAWLSVETISELATEALMQNTGMDYVSIDRMDVRPDKGIVKVNFEQAYWEVQVDGHTGEILSIARRHSDWIEQIHDGSIIGDLFKLFSMNLLGLALLMLTGSGLWLWLGPKKMRSLKHKQKA